MPTLQERYTKAYAELLAAREENEKMGTQFYAIKGKTNEATQALKKWADAGKRLAKAEQNERILADKIPEQLKREIQKMPLPKELRDEIGALAGIGGRRKTRNNKKSRKTRSRRRV